MCVAYNREGEIWSDPQDGDDHFGEVSRSAAQAPSDPHRLEAMQRALDEVADASGLGRIVLEPTDKYVRCLPDSVDVALLNQMHLTIYPYRLDGRKTVQLLF